MLDEHADGSRSDADGHDSDTVQQTVDVLAFAAQCMVQGLVYEFFGRLYSADTHGEFLKVFGQTEQVGGDSAGTGHSDGDAAVSHLVMQGPREYAYICLGGGIHGDTGHRSPAGHG